MVAGANISLREIPDLTLLRMNYTYTTTDAALDARVGVAAIVVPSDASSVVYGNQPTTPDEATRLSSDKASVEIDLNAVPDEVERIAVVLFIHPLPGFNRSLSQLRGLRMVAQNAFDHSVIARSANLSDLADSTRALIMAEVYRRGDEWKIKIIGQGFDDGLTAALDYYGCR